MDDDNPSCICLNMAAIIGAINQQLDLALPGFQEIDDLKVNLKDLHKENIDLKESLSYAHKEIAELKEISKFQEGLIEAHQYKQVLLNVYASVNAEKYPNGGGTC